MFIFDIVGWVVGWNLLFGAGGAYAGYKVRGLSHKVH